MTAVVAQDFADDRADVLASHGQNGLQLALVSLPAGPTPDHADLELRFFNGLHVAALLASLTPGTLNQVFRLRGGTRLPAGRAAGQVQVVAASGVDATRISLRIEPVGDYSTYTLDLRWDAERIDPFFARIDFKFRPGCFTNDCAPRLPGKPAAPGPAIDYQARDYDSFRHVLMTAMAERVPGWASTSEADFDQVLIDLIAATGDELADHQDRVMAEATLASARKRVSLARHARLVDYHLHEGNQASTWVALQLRGGVAPFTLSDEELVVWTGEDPAAPEAVHFASRELLLPTAQRQQLDARVNRLRLHTWRNAQPALRAGSTSADLVPPGGLPTQAAADALRDRVRAGLLRQLLIVEERNPLTGRVNGRNPAKRQLLRLLQGVDAAESMHDSIVGTWLIRVHWRAEDALRHDYSFTTFCSANPAAPLQPVEDISMFYGNLLPVFEGRPLEVHFHEEGSDLPTDSDTLRHRHFIRLDRRNDGADWALATLPEGPLAYTATPPGGEVPVRSTLQVNIFLGAVDTGPWDEVESLVHSQGSGENADHFMVETDEQQRSTLRFGNGVNGQLLPPGARIQARFQVGGGVRGNVGADQLTHAQLLGVHAADVEAAWNPFDVTDGRASESVEVLRRQAPEAFRARQLRAVTLADYVRRAEEVAGVSRAVARYAWTGSWRTVRITVDPVDTTVLSPALRAALAAHLESVRLIGEDIELRPPRYVPLEIHIRVCAQPDVWREDLRFVLEEEFSNHYTSDGRRGFFHPAQWSFGQALHRSAIEGRIHQLAGVRHVQGILMKRFNAPQPGSPDTEQLEMDFDEVLLLDNDPSHLERGLIRFSVTGGRQ